ncbi:MAG TPA: chemotaxis protein CheA [Roseiflexaceae bacterium]|nr:chemotaxis protein CheA [Roseiflexaceae bacterium]
MTDNPAPPFSEFLDDFFAECDEHLLAVRRALLALDGAAGQRMSDPQALDALLRSFHTIKGLAGMVGVQPVEQLAHQTEAYLRALRQGQATLSAEGLRALAHATTLTEQLLATYQSKGPLPEIAPILAQLAALLPPTGQPATNGAVLPGAAGQEQPGAPLWRVLFAPTADLTARGVNVNTVRAALEGLGQIVSATPRTEGPGRLVFEFLLASDVDPVQLAALADSGLSYERVLAQPIQPPTPPAARPRVHNGVVRVDLGRIDEVIHVVGELVIGRSRLREQLQPLEATLPVQPWRALQETVQGLERQLRELRQRVMQMRLVPVDELFVRMQFAARDLAEDQGRQVAVVLDGQGTEIDKYVVERMQEPLLHLVRNAVSHGLEPPAERIAAGKPPQGTLVLGATATGDTVLITVEDDGSGIDAERVAAKARAQGLIGADAQLDQDGLLALICAPGFSTRDQADRVSGRGVGMDVVAQAVQELRGELALRTSPGQGTRFAVTLPLTLAIVDALIVTVADAVFAVPLPAVREIVEIGPAAVTGPVHGELIAYRSGALPLVRLARRFGLAGRADRQGYALVIGAGQDAAGIAVDRIVGKREIVVRTLADPLLQIDGLAGATELGDGRPIFILDTAQVVRAGRRPAERPRPGQSPQRSSLEQQEAMADQEIREQYVLFELAGATYALPSRLVRHMEMVEQITPVPNTLPFVAGVVFSRGQVLPAIDMRVRFGFERIDYTPRTRMLVVDSGERTVGLIVDTAREFVAIARAAVQPPPSGIAGLSSAYLNGIARLGERLVLLIDLDEVLHGTDVQESEG